MRELILERTRRRHGADSMEVATALDFCGSARNHLRRYPEAIAFHQEALEIRRRHLPPDSLGLVQSYLYLANLQSAQQQEHEAELTYQRARKIYAANGEFVGEANCLDNLAGVLIKGGRLEEAETLRRESIELRIQHQGPTHPETANAHSHLAYLLLSQGQLEEAETHFRRCLEVRRQLYPETHKAIARAAGGLAEVLAKKGKAVESEAPRRQVPGSAGMER
jgi:tetratricopeptide (TPR) repeat protein